MLVAVIGLTGCSAVGPSDGLTGNYTEDTTALIETLRESITLPKDDPNKVQLQDEAKASSFATMRTALNALAGHYSSYPNRPVPQKLQERLEQEFRQVEAALRRGA